MSSPSTTSKVRQIPAELLPLLDVVLVFAAFALAYYVRYELQIIRPVFEPFRSGFGPYLPYAAIFALMIYGNFRALGLYRGDQRGRSLWDELYAVSSGVANSTIILFGLYFLFQPLVFSRLMALYIAIIATLLIGLTRIARRVIRSYLRSRGIGVQRTLVVGAGEVGLAVLRTMVSRSELGYLPVGYLDDNPERISQDLGRVKALGTTDFLLDAIRDEAVDTVVITLPWKQHEHILRLVQKSRNAGLEVRIVPDLFQLNMRQVQVENLDGIPLLGVNGDAILQGHQRIAKRVLDLALIVLSSPLLLILFALVALAIRLESRGPVFYTQRRIGLNGKSFNMIKFRSMIPNADELREQLIKERGEDPRHPKLKDDPRVTRVGRFIRATSLDELPNLFNVLRGQMSLVGPRPPTPDEVALYEPWHRQRLQTLPGLTGLWQINGRSDIPFDEMCLMDIYYIENWSVALDAQILVMTLPRVLLRHGAY
jgi:exopolysaccharide biosynthesis polyprenyl glycosylphosphotransferase